MRLVPWILLFVAILHMLEEYILPGGFLGSIGKLNPRIAGFLTVRFAITINGAFLVYCIVGILVIEHVPILSLSVAGTCMVNGVIHLAASVLTRRYVPGLVTAVLLYLPVSSYAFFLGWQRGILSYPATGLSLLLAIAIHLVPILYLGASSWADRTREVS